MTTRPVRIGVKRQCAKQQFAFKSAKGKRRHIGGVWNIGGGQVLAGPTESRRITSGWSLRQLMWIPRIWLDRA